MGGSKKKLDDTVASDADLVERRFKEMLAVSRMTSKAMEEVIENTKRLADVDPSAKRQEVVDRRQDEERDDEHT